MSAGRPKGTAKDGSLRGVVRFRCQIAEKSKWVKRAQKDGKTLSEWIIDRLNAD